MNIIGAPLYIPVSLSSRLHLFGVILHVFALLISFIAWPPIPSEIPDLSSPDFYHSWLLKLVIPIGVLMSFYAMERDFRRIKDEIQSILLKPDGSWILSLTNDEPCTAATASLPFVRENLVIICIKTNNGQRWRLGFTTDNLSPHKLRRLIVRLRFPPT